MEIDWGAATPLAAAVLVFIVGIWRILEDRSVLRRLERLVAIREAMRHGTDAQAHVDETIALLAARTRRRETPRTLLSTLTNIGISLFLLSIVGHIILLLAFEGEPGQDDPWRRLYDALTGTGYVGLILTLLAVFLPFIASAFLDLARLLQSLFYRPRR